MIAEIRTLVRFYTVLSILDCICWERARDTALLALVARRLKFIGSTTTIAFAIARRYLWNSDYSEKRARYTEISRLIHRIGPATTAVFRFRTFSRSRVIMTKLRRLHRRVPRRPTFINREVSSRPDEAKVCAVCHPRNITADRVTGCAMTWMRPRLFRVYACVLYIHGMKFSPT